MNLPLLLTSSLVCTVLTYMGGVIYSQYYQSHPNRNFLPSVIAAGGGYLLAISFLELLPMSVEKHGGEIHEIAGLALLGVVAVASAHRVMQKGLRFQFRSKRHQILQATDFNNEPNHQHNHLHVEQEATISGNCHPCCSPIIGIPVAHAAMSCLVICSFFDGILVTSGFQAGQRIGLSVLIGEVMHLVPEGIIAASLVLGSGQNVRASKNAALVVGSAFLAGTLFPFVIHSQPTWAIPFSLGIALYVTFGQLLPMIRNRPDTWRWLAGGSGFYFLVHQLMK